MPEVVCVPARAVFFTATAVVGGAGAVVAAEMAPWLLIGPCMALMLGYPAVCALLEHHRRRGGGRSADRAAAALPARGRDRG